MSSRKQRAAEQAGTAAVSVSRSIGIGARWAHAFATEGTADERRFAAGTTVVATLVLAIVVGSLATLAVHGSALAAVLVIVAGIALGMAVLAALVLTTRHAEGGVMGLSRVDAVSRELAAELEVAAAALGLSGTGWPVGREALARWLTTTPTTIDAWLSGRESIPELQVPQVRAFVDMASTLADNIRPERLPVILATRPVLMLGGRTYFQALNDGAPLDLVADSARLTIGGEDVETDQARAYARRQTPVLWSPEPGVKPKPRKRTTARKTAASH